MANASRLRPDEIAARFVLSVHSALCGSQERCV